MKWRYIPNLISLFRIVCVGPVLYSLSQEAYGWAFALFVLSACSDAVDGYLARRFGWLSPLGALIDPIADKLLLVMSFLTLMLQGLIPGIFFWAMFMRELLIISGALAYRMWFGGYRIHPRFLSKLNTVFQLIYVAGLLFSLCDLPGASLLTLERQRDLMGIALGTTVLSGLDYVWIWGQKAREAYLKRLRSAST